MFARAGQGYACQRALSMGKTKEHINIVGKNVFFPNQIVSSGSNTIIEHQAIAHKENCDTFHLCAYRRTNNQVVIRCRNDLIREEYILPDNVDMFDVGCMSLDMISKVNEYDFMITVDAVDESGSEPGTVFRYRPHDIARTCGARTSLHDTKLADLFDAAALLGYASEGMCYGMQVLNLEPAEFMEGLTQPVTDRLPFLAESVIAELVRQGCNIERKDGVPLPELPS